MPVQGLKNTSSVGARLAIRMLQDAAESGEIDPWDIDVITVVDGFLDQLRQRIDTPKRLEVSSGGTFERDLDDSSEAFLAASVLVGLKAEVLEIETFPLEEELEDVVPKAYSFFRAYLDKENVEPPSLEDLGVEPAPNVEDEGELFV